VQLLMGKQTSIEYIILVFDSGCSCWMGNRLPLTILCLCSILGAAVDGETDFHWRYDACVWFWVQLLMGKQISLMLVFDSWCRCWHFGNRICFRFWLQLLMWKKLCRHFHEFESLDANVEILRYQCSVFHLNWITTCWSFRTDQITGGQTAGVQSMYSFSKYLA
jgi:hypothetical protein